MELDRYSQNIMMSMDAFDEEKKYWLEKLDGEIVVCGLPIDRERPVLSCYEKAVIECPLPPGVSGKLHSLSNNSVYGTYMLLLSGIKYMVYRYTGNEDIIVGSPVIKQSGNDINAGNILALRTQLKRSDTFKEFLMKVKATVDGAGKYKNIPFHKIADFLDIRLGDEKAPLFNIIVLSDDLHYRENVGGIKADIVFSFSAGEENIDMRLEYNSKLFRKETIQQFTTHLIEIYKNIAKNPNGKLSDIEILPGEERRRILFDFNNTEAPYPKDKLIGELFEEQVEKTPDSMALVFKKQNFTYRELDIKSNQLAGTLREKGVLPGSIAGILVERSPEMVIGILGVLKAGGAYLPIDPEYPVERIKFMLEDSGVGIVLTGRNTAAQIPDMRCLDIDDERIYQGDGTALENICTSNELAYVIYTSGSTGKPKGIMIEHRSVNNFIKGVTDKIEFLPGDTILALTTISFDIFVLETLLPLTRGLRVVIADEEQQRDAEMLNKAIINNNVDMLQITPSRLQMLLNYGGSPDCLRNLKEIMVGGEAFPESLLEKLQKLTSAKIHNMYGPTETTVWSAIKDLTGANAVTIGTPIANTRIYILSKDNAVQPAGAVGELCIAGDGLARGYLNNPELTAEKFVPDPFLPPCSPQADVPLMYRTGDFARMLPDGDIECLGRMDYQVKIRGFRIELGEIEERLLKNGLIKEAAAVVKEDAGGNKHICAYIVSDNDIPVQGLREYLSCLLPDYMVPSFFVRMRRLPETPNGKLDRKALPEPEMYVDTGVEYEPPGDAIEKQLAEVWRRILGFERIGINDSFFELGGNSLQAMTLDFDIHRIFNVKIPLREVFKNPTIKELGKYIRRSGRDIYSAIQRAEEKEFYPLSSVQKRMYILNALESEQTSYNLPGAVIAEGDFNKEHYENSVRLLVQRHESLRTSFSMVDGEPVQKIHKDTDIKIECMEIEKFCDYDKDGCSDDTVMSLVAAFIRPFDLSRAPLLRAGIAELPGGRHLLLFDMHHIISDGISTDILVREFISLYHGEDLPPLRIQYKDYSEWQNRLFETNAIKEQEEYWTKEFSGEIPVLNLPTDYIRPLIQNFEGSRVTVELNSEMTLELKRLAAGTDSTLYMVILALYNILLSIYTGQEDIVVGSPIAGRPHGDLKNIIGMFVNTLAIRNYPLQHNTFGEFLASVKEQVLTAFENQDYPFEELVEKMNIPRDLGRNPLFDVMFVLQNTDNSPGPLSGLKFTSYEYRRRKSTFDLTLEAAETGGIIRFNFDYCVKLFKRETVQRMAEHFLNIINQVSSDSQITLSRVNLLSGKERKQLLFDFNNTEVEYPDSKTIHELFELQVEKNPESTAVIFEDKALTYGEFNDRANQIGRTLMGNGVKSGGHRGKSVVAVMAKRSVEMVIGLISVLKAGGAYLPVDPGYPEERIRYMLSDSGADILLTQRSLQPENRNWPVEKIIYMDDEEVSREEGSNIGEPVKAGDLAYIIYTSGSTGKPRGVMIEHKSVVNFISWRIKEYGFKPEDRTLQLISVSFDGFGANLYSSLLSGGSLILLNDDHSKDFNHVRGVIADQRVTNMSIVPSMYSAILENAGSRDLNSLRFIVLAAEKSNKDLIERSRSINPGILLVNEYGPTENTITTTSYAGMLPENTSLIGKPISNNRIYIMDRNGRLTPVGLPGELHISGAGLSRGYLNQTELTEKKFIPNPFLNGKMMYRTGDLARWLPDGNIEFLGRVDHQVKIRGYRVELGEIESEIRKYEFIKDATVVDREDSLGCRCLYAYYIPLYKGMDETGLKNFLSKRLPDYMLPVCYIPMEAFPLNSNGKLDRNMLPEPENNTGTEEFAAPETETEEKILEIWKEIFKTGTISTTGNFYDLGGNSLKATIFVSRMHKRHNVEISLAQMFKIPTIKELARYVEGLEKNICSSIQPVEEREYYPLSPAQKRLYILGRLEGSDSAYHMSGAMMIEGIPDKDRLENAFRLLVERHEALRTSFDFAEGNPVQKVHKKIEFRISFMEAGEDKTEDVIAGFIKPFDLSRAPLFRVGLVTMVEERHVLIFDMHHIISDGISMGILIDEFCRLYHGVALPALKVQYKDYSIWQNSEERLESIKKQKEYWLSRFAGEIPVLNMPTDYPRPGMQSFEGSRIRFVLDRKSTAGLRSIASRTGATMYMVLLAAYNVLLHKYTGQEEIIVGSPVAGRPHADLENIIGVFVNTLAMKNYPKKNMRFLDFLADLKENTLRAYENQDYQFEELVEKLELRRDLSRNPLFDTMFGLQNMDINSMEFTDISFSPCEFENNTSKLDITLEAVEIGEVIEFSLEYCTRLYSRDTIERFAGHYKNILECLVENAEKTISEIEVMSAEEKRQLLEFNNTKCEYPGGKTIHKLFEEQVERTPGNTAVIFNESRLTYEDLNKRANQLGAALIEKGVRPGSIVALMMQRSPEMLAGILGILKAGGAYLPIDPEYPGDRIEYMLEDSQANILLTQDHLTGKVSFGGEIISIGQEGMYHSSGVNCGETSKPSDLAYVIYTSGSTGKPKGVMIEHRAVNNFIKGVTDRIEFCEGKSILVLTTLSFDIFVLETLLPLAKGLKLVIADEDSQRDMKLLSGVIADKKVDMVQTTPSRLQIMLEDESTAACLNRVSEIMVGGEELPQSLFERLKRVYSGRIYNMYGPTETTVWSTIKDLTGCSVVDIGKPIANTGIYIVDAGMKQQPLGIAGEMYIAGDGLARGYIGRPGLTEEKFVPNPFCPGEKMYRTGDIAKWLPGGNIKFLGRADSQVKIRGYRIELSEIEMHLQAHENIKEAAVLARGDTGGSKYLCAYIVTDLPLKAAEIKMFLGEKLPEYMLPASFTEVKSIPLTPNGKVDRKALDAVKESFNTEVPYSPPRGRFEEELAHLWEELLGVERIGRDDNFFEHSGNSLKAATLVSRVNKAFNVILPLREVFKSPTIGQLANYISYAGKSPYSSIQPVVPKEYYSVSSAQKRMFIVSRFEDKQVRYNIPGATIIDGRLDKAKLQESLGALVKRHEALRTSFDFIEEEPVQRVHADVDFKISYIEKNSITDNGMDTLQNETFNKVITDIVEEFIRPFDLGKAPLFRAGLIKLSVDRHILLFDIHHIISDASSMGILIRDFISLYNGDELEELVVQYKDFSQWQNGLFKSDLHKKQEQYWLNLFSGEIPILDMPADYPRPSIQSAEGAGLKFGAPKELKRKLDIVARETGATMYMVLLTAYYILLYKHTGQGDIIVGSASAGRPHADLENVIGIFANTLAMRNFPDENNSYEEFLAEVKANALDAFENQDYQFEELVKRLGIQRSLSRNPLFDYGFGFQASVAKELRAKGLNFTVFEFEKKVSKMDLSLLVYETQEELEFSFEYCTKLFKEETVKGFSEDYIKILEHIASDRGIKIGAITLANEYKPLQKSIHRAIEFDFSDI